MIRNGVNRHTLAVIVDILDNHYVMVDGKPFKQDELGKPSYRTMKNLENLVVTPLSVKVSWDPPRSHT